MWGPNQSCMCVKHQGGGGYARCFGSWPAVVRRRARLAGPPKHRHRNSVGKRTRKCPAAVAQSLPTVFREVLQGLCCHLVAPAHFVES